MVAGGRMLMDVAAMQWDSYVMDTMQCVRSDRGKDAGGGWSKKFGRRGYEVCWGYVQGLLQGMERDAYLFSVKYEYFLIRQIQLNQVLSL